MKNTQAQKDYEKIQEKSRLSSILSGISSLLDWDQETHMPPAGAGIRSEQLKVLAGLTHKAKTNPSFAKDLSN